MLKFARFCTFAMAGALTLATASCTPPPATASFEFKNRNDKPATSYKVTFELKEKGTPGKTVKGKLTVTKTPDESTKAMPETWYFPDDKKEKDADQKTEWSAMRKTEKDNADITTITGKYKDITESITIRCPKKGKDEKDKPTIIITGSSGPRLGTFQIEESEQKDALAKLTELGLIK